MSIFPRLLSGRLAALYVATAMAVAAPSLPLLADSPRALVKEGNKKYLGGDYAKALEIYGKASVGAPESPVILFNQGDALFRQREFQKAREAFDRAAQKAGDLPFEARCRYNIGNVDLQLAKRQTDSDPRKAISLYESAIRAYQDALRLQPGYPEAAHNLEVARILMKSLMDELSKNPGGCQAKQEQNKEMQEELKKLIEEQGKEAGQNRSLSERQKKEGQESVSKDVQNLASDQKQTGEKTGKLGEKMEHASKQNQQNAGDSPMDKAREEVEKARQEQSSASGSLDQKDLDGARPRQEKAIDHLKKALEEMGGEPQQGGEQQQQQQGQKEEQKQGSQDQQQQKKKQESQEKKAAAQAKADKNAPKPKDEKAQDILREEMENKDKQMRNVQGGYVPVDKDW